MFYKTENREHVEPLIRESSYLNMSQRISYLSANILYNVLHFKIPDYLFKLLILRSEVNSRDTRFKSHLDIPKHKSKKFKSSLSYVGPNIYKSYCSLFDRHKCRNAFKKALKNTIKRSS